MRKRDLPPMEERTLCVMYVCRRRCRHNPSLRRFAGLPGPLRQSLLERWSSSHRGRALPDLEVSDRPPKRRRR